METLLQDFRYGVRMLRKTPGATLVALLSLALGIGATTAIFTIVNAVMLRPVPFHDAGSLAVIWEQNLKKNISQFKASPPNFRDWAERNRSFTQICALRPAPVTMIGTGQPERLEIVSVSPQLFSMLGVNATYGRLLVPGDSDPARSRVAVLSNGLWQRRFGADRSVLGRNITLDSINYTVVGVANPGLRLFNIAAEVWVPYILDSQELSQRGFHNLNVIGRLKPGVTIEQAQSEMTSISGQLAAEYPDKNANWSVGLVPLRQQLTGDLRQPLLILLGAVGLVLLIACTNAAGILLMKAGVRHRELAIRTALGASPARMLVQLLTESVVLSLAAAVLGIALAAFGTHLLSRLIPPSIADLGDLDMDWRVLMFALVLGVGTGVLFGLVPGISAMRTDLNTTLRSAGRSGMSSIGWGRARSFLVAGELMLAQILLIGAALLVHSLLNLQTVPPGFHPERVISMRLALPETSYKGSAVARFYQRLLDKVSALPGVEHAAVTRDLPLSGMNPNLNFEIEGRPQLSPSEQPRARYRTASSDYFAALGIRLVRGRFFERGDSEKSPPVALINESLARREWANEDPIGRRIRSGFDDSPWCTIVGVIGDVKAVGLDTPADAEVYYHYSQIPPSIMTVAEGSMGLVIRTHGDPAAIVGAVRAEVSQLDGDLALYGVKTADELIAGSVAQPRFRTTLLALFAAAALVLSAIGLYGLLASSVLQRTSELGIRKALGATVGDLLRLIVSQGLVLASAGILAGLIASFGLARLVEKMLFGVTTRDWIAFSVTPILLLMIVLAASLVPAMRAARVDPAIALRDQ